MSQIALRQHEHERDRRLEAARKNASFVAVMIGIALTAVALVVATASFFLR